MTTTLDDKQIKTIKNIIRLLRNLLSVTASYLRGFQMADLHGALSEAHIRRETPQAEKYLERLRKDYLRLRRLERYARRHGIRLSMWQGRSYTETVLAFKSKREMKP